MLVEILSKTHKHMRVDVFVCGSRDINLFHVSPSVRKTAVTAAAVASTAAQQNHRSFARVRRGSHRWLPLSHSHTVPCRGTAQKTCPEGAITRARFCVCCAGCVGFCRCPHSMALRSFCATRVSGKVKTDCHKESTFRMRAQCAA